MPQSEKFWNPYRWVTLGSQPVTHATPGYQHCLQGLSGRVECELEALTPLLVGDGRGEFSRRNHKPFVPATSRKGAIRARDGDLGIVPGSMGARSYIVRGKGNPDSFCSSAHGAGRRMSRTAAEKQFTEADMVKQTEGVICRKDKGVIDEIPGAYKDIDEVMANQSDLTEVLHTLKQVVCVKG